jgi:glutamate racemase
VKPIGVFDSGMGGLTVLREIAKVLPGQDTIYLGDTARVPYGVRSPETIKRYARENAQFLFDQGIRALVVACNTATAVALDDLVENLPIPVFGVVQPGAARAAAAAPDGTIAVLATEATVRSGAYDRAIKKLAPNAKVVGRACPLFVPLAEEGWIDNDVARAAAAQYLGDLGPVDAVVLGCTHYPLLRATIAAALAPGVSIVDSAQSMAAEVALAFPDPGGVARRKFFVTDAPERFARIGARFLGHPLDDVTHVNL